MTQIEHLREQAQRAERLARNVLDAVTVSRLLEASSDYRRQADSLQRSGIENDRVAAERAAATLFE